MGKLVNYGAGEIADRLTILALKILVGTEQGKPVDHFRNERNALVTQLNVREVGPWLEQFVELAGVNALLWHAEDDLRAARQRWTDPTHDVDGDEDTTIKLAFRIQSLNDQRAALIGTINERAGDKLASEREKL